MPGLCLSNTIARWKTLKTEKQHRFKLIRRTKAVKTPARPPRIYAPRHPDDGFVYDAYLQIQHTRPRLVAQFQDRSSASATSLSDIINALTSPHPATAPAASSNTVPTPSHLATAPVTSSQPAYYLPQPLPLSEHPTRADLINAESRLGSTIFGPIPVGHRREFFHDRDSVWIWHEDWLDSTEQPQQLTVRYEVRTSGVFKKVAAGRYLKLEGDELDNFRKATRAYLKIIKQNLYQNIVPATPVNA